jgi:hypothetical protein
MKRESDTRVGPRRISELRAMGISKGGGYMGKELLIRNAFYKDPRLYSHYYTLGIKVSLCPWLTNCCSPSAQAMISQDRSPHVRYCQHILIHIITQIFVLARRQSLFIQDTDYVRVKMLCQVLAADCFAANSIYTYLLLCTVHS